MKGGSFRMPAGHALVAERSIESAVFEHPCCAATVLLDLIRAGVSCVGEQTPIGPRHAMSRPGERRWFRWPHSKCLRQDPSGTQHRC